MKKISLFFIIIVIASSLFAQKKSIYINTEVDMNYQLFIDDELQSYGISSEYKLIGLTPGKKKLSIKTFTKSNQSPSIDIGTTNDKIEYYTIIFKEGKYSIVKKPAFKFKSEINTALCYYIPKRIPAKLDSNYKQPHTCKISDSIVNEAIKNMVLLTNRKSRENYLNSSFGRKCLQSSQLKSIGYRIDDDKEKFDLYMKFHRTCIDNSEFKILIETFTNQEYANKFDTWLKNQL